MDTYFDKPNCNNLGILLAYYVTDICLCFGCLSRTEKANVNLNDNQLASLAQASLAKKFKHDS